MRGATLGLILGSVVFSVTGQLLLKSGAARSRARPLEFFVRRARPARAGRGWRGDRRRLRSTPSCRTLRGPTGTTSRTAHLLDRLLRANRRRLTCGTMIVIGIACLVAGERPGPPRAGLLLVCRVWPPLRSARYSVTRCRAACSLRYGTQDVPARSSSGSVFARRCWTGVRIVRSGSGGARAHLTAPFTAPWWIEAGERSLPTGRDARQRSSRPARAGLPVEGPRTAGEAWLIHRGDLPRRLDGRSCWTILRRDSRMVPATRHVFRSMGARERRVRRALELPARTPPGSRYDRPSRRCTGQKVRAGGALRPPAVSRGHSPAGFFLRSFGALPRTDRRSHSSESFREQPEQRFLELQALRGEYPSA